MEPRTMFANDHIYNDEKFSVDKDRVIYDLVEILLHHDDAKEEFRHGSGTLSLLRDMRDTLNQKISLRTFYGDAVEGSLRDGRSVDRILSQLRSGIRLERQLALDGLCSFYVYRAREGVIVEELYRSADFRLSNERLPRLRSWGGSTDVFLRLPIKQWVETNLKVTTEKAIDKVILRDIAPVMYNALHLDQGFGQATRLCGAMNLPNAIEAVYFALNAEDDMSTLTRTQADHAQQYLGSEHQDYLLAVYLKFMSSNDRARADWAELAAMLYVDLANLLGQLLKFEVGVWGHYVETRILFEIIAANTRRPAFIARLVESEPDLVQLIQQVDKMVEERFSLFLGSLK